MFATVEAIKAKNINPKECFKPAFIFPSASFPIVSPVKKPWTNIKYKKEFEIELNSVNPKIELDVSYLTNGAYIIKLITAYGIESKKLIIAK